MVYEFRPNTRKEIMPSKRVYLARAGARYSELVRDESLNEEANRVYLLGLEIAEPVVYWRFVSVEEIPPRLVPSRIGGFDTYVVMVSTLGEKIDRTIEDLSRESTLRAFLLDSWASEALEKLNNSFQRTFEKTRDVRTSFRFSPGYGDLPLDANADFVDMLSLRGKIVVLPSGVLIPRKTTACIMGVARRT